jgi:hypothetical protein
MFQNTRLKCRIYDVESPFYSFTHRFQDHQASRPSRLVARFNPISHLTLYLFGLLALFTAEADMLA